MRAYNLIEPFWFITEDLGMYFQWKPLSLAFGNIEASVRFKYNAVLEHDNSRQHKSAVEAELIQRVSVFHKEIE